MAKPFFLVVGLSPNPVGGTIIETATFAERDEAFEYAQQDRPARYDYTSFDVFRCQLGEGGQWIGYVSPCKFKDAS